MHIDSYTYWRFGRLFRIPLFKRIEFGQVTIEIWDTDHEVLTGRELKRPEMCYFIEINDYLRAGHDVTLRHYNIVASICLDFRVLPLYKNLTWWI